MRVCVVGGAGHVGLPLAMLLADRGLQVDILDVNEAALEKIRQGKMPFLENGAEEILPRVLASGRLAVTTDTARAREADVVICVIGTPVDKYQNPETVLFYKIIEELRGFLRDGQTLILRSTVYPGLSERINRMFQERGPKVHVAFCPERVAQGESLKEMTALPQIISAFDEEGLATAKAVFGKLTADLVVVKPLEAELAKLMSNAYRYITFAIANQFHMLATDAGVDFTAIHKAATWHYPRLATMPRPGFAAGPCLYKDTLQLAAFSNNNFFLGHSAMLVNEGQPQYLINSIKKRTNLQDKTVGILGMTFKADCDDTRESLSYKLRRLMMLEARKVILHDPYLEGPDFVSLEQLLEEADVIVVGVPHREYRGLKIAKGKVVEDIWNCVAK